LMRKFHTWVWIYMPGHENLYPAHTCVIHNNASSHTWVRKFIPGHEISYPRKLVTHRSVSLKKSWKKMSASSSVAERKEKRSKRFIARAAESPMTQGCQIFLGTWYPNRKKCTKWTQNKPNGRS
jgi:hypothetical protein